MVRLVQVCVLFLVNLPYFSVLSSSMDENMPGPFTRVLSLHSPPLEGKDVVILQNLLARVSQVPATDHHGHYDKHTELAVIAYQRLFHVPSTVKQGVFEEKTAMSVLDRLMHDGYKDDFKPPPEGYKFKIYVPVHKNRSTETTAFLMDANNTVRYKFTVRAHGAMNDKGQPINQLTTNGNTPTGLMTFDLNTPEPNPRSYGPYPVLRAVRGLKGNAALGINSTNTFISDYRNGILLHTGEWDDWNPSKLMPNSLGCLHCHPEDMYNIDSILVNDLGVEIRDNPFNSRNYPYKEQGILSIEQIDF